MTRSTDIPYCFAILRTDRLDGPCLQFLRAEIHHQYDGDAGFAVENISWADEMRYMRYREMENNEFDHGIYTFRYEGAHHERERIQEFKFWFLPFFYERNGVRIPVIDFQFKSWLPSMVSPIPIRDDERYFLQIYDDIHSRRMRELFDGRHLQHGSRFDVQDQFDRFQSFAGEQRRQPFLRRNLRNGRRFSGIVDIPIRSPSPPRRRNLRRETFYEPSLNMIEIPDMPQTPPHSTQDQWWQIAVGAGAGQPAPPPAPLRIPIQIPKHIGEILLAHARTGSDSCPIAATPFAECTKLAITPCFHIFDADNLQRWQSTNNTCPVCRTAVASVVVETRTIPSP